jgi:heme-degrading monooxygenase HmoA
MTTATPDDGPITFINVFEIPVDEIDAFIAKWKERSRFITAADGFISAELHRAIDSEPRFKLINVTQWESLAHFEAATHAPDFRTELDQFAATSSWQPHRGFYRTAAKFD